MKRYKQKFTESKIPKANAYWINPKGQILPVDTKHINFVLKNPRDYGLTKDEIEELYRAEGEKLGQEGRAREKIILSLIKKGWIRIRHYLRRGWTVNVPNLTNKVKDWIGHWASEIIKLGMDKYETVYIDLPSGGKSYLVSDLSKDVLYFTEGSKEIPEKRFLLECVNEFPWQDQD